MGETGFNWFSEVGVTVVGLDGECLVWKLINIESDDSDEVRDDDYVIALFSAREIDSSEGPSWVVMDYNWWWANLN